MDVSGHKHIFRFSFFFFWLLLNLETIPVAPISNRDRNTHTGGVLLCGQKSLNVYFDNHKIILFKERKKKFFVWYFRTRINRMVSRGFSRNSKLCNTFVFYRTALVWISVKSKILYKKIWNLNGAPKFEG